MLRSILSISLLFISIFSCSQPREEKMEPVTLSVEEKTWFFRIGSTTVPVKTYAYGERTAPVFIHLHDDETTAFEAARQVLHDSGGLLIKIENRNQRYISFRTSRRVYRFDPNRIFTPEGIEGTLKALNGSYTEAAVKQVENFASFLLSKIPSDASVIIALHNNSEGNLSIESYGSRGDLSADASRVSANPMQDGDNFLLTTNGRIFEDLAAAGYNMVLQDNRNVSDDGSLSVYSGRKDLPYINIEAADGALSVQVQMIRHVIQALRAQKLLD